MLSLLRSLILSNDHKAKLIDFKKTNKYNTSHADCRIIVKNNYEELLSEIMVEESQDAPLTYDLPKEYIDYIAITMQRVKSLIVKDIQDLISDHTFTDDMIESMLISSVSDEEERE